jgi:hypothetical protein
MQMKLAFSIAVLLLAALAMFMIGRGARPILQDSGCDPAQWRAASEFDATDWNTNKQTRTRYFALLKSQLNGTARSELLSRLGAADRKETASGRPEALIYSLGVGDLVSCGALWVRDMRVDFDDKDRVAAVSYVQRAP